MAAAAAEGRSEAVLAAAAEERSEAVVEQYRVMGVGRIIHPPAMHLVSRAAERARHCRDEHL